MADTLQTNTLAPALTSPVSLRVSVVVWQSDMAVLENTLHSLMLAAEHAQNEAVLGGMLVVLIDNGSQQASIKELLARTGLDAQLLSGHGNIGYGRGHNLAIQGVALKEPQSTEPQSTEPAIKRLEVPQPTSLASALTNAASDFHLILNPDVYLQADTLAQGLHYLVQNPAAVAVAPAITDAAGQQEPACRRYPSVLDFFLRGFAPATLRLRFSQRLSRYEMRDLSAERATAGVPIISGCFMLFRQSVLRDLGGFDPRYFLYFEDYDLSLRAHNHGSLHYLPGMRVIHLGGHTARKGLRHIALFVRSAIRFFNTHGWRWS